MKQWKTLKTLTLLTADVLPLAKSKQGYWQLKSQHYVQLPPNVSRISEGLICGTSRISLPTNCSKSFSRSWRCNTSFLTVFQTEILMLVDTVLVLLEIHTVTSTKASGQSTKPTSFLALSTMIPPSAICCPQRGMVLLP